MNQASQSSPKSHLAHLSHLDHMRPQPGWKTDCALFSTYSAHTPVLAAILLALSGQEDEVGSGSKIGFARSLTELRGKVHFILQGGRLTVPKNPSPIAALMDRFILEVPWDEGSKGANKGQSWHAKFALVRHVPINKELKDERWVFMLGSRNLTLDMSWDIGLVLKTDEKQTRDLKSNTQFIPGIQMLTSSLIELFPTHLKDWRLQRKSLESAEWRVPTGLVINGIHLDMPKTSGRSFPKPMPNLQRILAIAPFLDVTTVSNIATWGGADVNRQLISTHLALEEIASKPTNKLDRFSILLTLPAPEHEVMLGISHDDGDNQVAADQIGLHAKVLFVEHETGYDMWMGSPNLTSRAWTRNAECYAHISIPKPIRDSGKLLLDGLDAFVDLGRPVSQNDLESMSTADTAMQRLSEARNQVAAKMMNAKQSLGGNNSLWIKCMTSPHPDEQDIKLSCGTLTGSLALWPLSKDQLEIAGAAMSVSRSDCLRIRLTLGESEVEWVQIIPWYPAITEDRDTSVLSHYLGPRQMLSWIHEVLYGYSDGDEGGAWDEQPKKSTQLTIKKSTIQGLPSIDQALRLWIKDKKKLDEVDRILKICDQTRKVETLNLTQDEKLVNVHLRKFSRSWHILRKALREDMP